MWKNVSNVSEPPETSMFVKAKRPSRSSLERTSLNMEPSSNSRISKKQNDLACPNKQPKTKPKFFDRRLESCRNHRFIRFDDSLETASDDSKSDRMDNNDVFALCPRLLNSKSELSRPDKLAKARLAEWLLHTNCSNGVTRTFSRCQRKFLDSSGKYDSVDRTESESDFLVDDHVKDYQKDENMSSPKLLRAFGGNLKPVYCDGDILDTVFQLGLGKQ